MKIKMLKTVRPDFPLLAAWDTILLSGEVYEAVKNKCGSVSGICDNGILLGVKPGEFIILKEAI